MVITIVFFSYSSEPSIISEERIWAIVKKRLPTTALELKSVDHD